MTPFLSHYIQIQRLPSWRSALHAAIERGWILGESSEWVITQFLLIKESSDIRPFILEPEGYKIALSTFYIVQGLKAARQPNATAEIEHYVNLFFHCVLTDFCSPANYKMGSKAVETLEKRIKDVEPTLLDDQIDPVLATEEEINTALSDASGEGEEDEEYVDEDDDSDDIDESDDLDDDEDQD